MTEVFSPQWGNPSLRTMTEVEFPEPVSMLPSTPGWWILLLGLVWLLLRQLWRWRQRYLRDQYRRDALVKLTEIKDQLDAGGVEPVRGLAPLLRGTAMTAAGRESISGLQGDDYASALADLDPHQERLPVEKIHHLAYASLDDFEKRDVDALIAAMERWILCHRREHA